MDPIAFGIDLGTTNSAGAFVRPGRGEPELAPGSDGEALIPSEVFVQTDGEVLVGRAAQRAAVLEPERHFQHWKRDMGDPDWLRTIDDRVYTPVLLSSFVLRSVRASLEKAAGRGVVNAVITVPAWYGDLQRAAVVDAARIAGIARVHMINEPTAAALSFGLGPDAALEGEPKRVLVYDLGGGTFDVTVAEVARGRVRVLATAGEPRLGGKDWDDELLNLVAEDVLDKGYPDPREDVLSNHELRDRVVGAKHELSTASRAVVHAPIPGEGRTLAVEVDRARFEARTRPLLVQTETQLDLAREKARLAWKDVHAVLLAGGATRMPMVAALVREVSGRIPLLLPRPEEAVARGAALYAALHARGGGVDEDSSAAAAPLPSKRPPSGIRPALSDIALPEETESDELPLLPGKCRVPEVVDVVAHGLGVLVLTKRGGKNVVLIPEQTPIPANRSRTFHTIRPGQTAVCVKVLEGGAADPDGCTLIGTLIVDGLPPGRPKGQKVEVTYEVDEDGRIQVSARDAATGKAARAVIERRGAIPDDEIARLGREVEERVRA